MTSVLATVRVWDDAEGWGVCDAPSTPGGCWVHYSVVEVAEVSGYRRLRPGDQVRLVAEVADQDGFAFRAVRCWSSDIEPASPAPAGSDSPAHRSELHLTFDVDRSQGRPTGA